MPRMLRELQARPELGFLHAEQYFGRTTLMVQYWNSFEQLERYARSRDHAHLPAWAQFNRAVRNNTDVGVWHETYVVTPGAFECIYVNMPPFGLGKVGPLVEATGARERARDRLRAA